MKVLPLRIPLTQVPEDPAGHKHVLLKPTNERSGHFHRSPAFSPVALGATHHLPDPTRPALQLQVWLPLVLEHTFDPQEEVYLSR